jgi:hypothetical protein
MVFSCGFATVFRQFHVWTLFLSEFYRSMGGAGGGFSGGMAFLMILFEVYMAMVYYPPRERDLGSTTFLAWLMLLNAFIALIFCGIMFCMGLVAGDPRGQMMKESSSLQGMWPGVLVCLALKSLSDPTGSTSFWGVMMIPNKWYPLALAGFFCLVNGQIMWDFVAALIVSYAYPYLPIERLLPSRVRAHSFERRFPGCSTGRPRQCLGASWVTATATPGFEAESGDRRYATLSDFGRSGGGSQTASRNPQPDAEPNRSGGGSGGNFEVFAGSGNRLGDGGTESLIQEQPLPEQASQVAQALQVPAGATVAADSIEMTEGTALAEP